MQLWFYVAMYWYLLCLSLYLVLWTLATLIFSLQFFHMNVVIKENFPKLPYFLIWLSDTRFFYWSWFLSIFYMSFKEFLDWLNDIFLNIIHGYCWIIIISIGIFFYENISFCMRNFFYSLIICFRCNARAKY